MMARGTREPSKMKDGGYISIEVILLKLKCMKKNLNYKEKCMDLWWSDKWCCFDWDLEEKIDYSINSNRNLVPNHLKSSNEQDALNFLDNKNHNDFKNL